MTTCYRFHARWWLVAAVDLGTWQRLAGAIDLAPILVGNQALAALAVSRTEGDHLVAGWRLLGLQAGVPVHLALDERWDHDPPPTSPGRNGLRRRLTAQGAETAFELTAGELLLRGRLAPAPATASRLFPNRSAAAALLQSPVRVRAAGRSQIWHEEPGSTPLRPCRAIIEACPTPAGSPVDAAFLTAGGRLVVAEEAPAGSHGHKSAAPEASI